VGFDRNFTICVLRSERESLRENLAEWLDSAASGEEILVADRGKPKAVLSAAETAYDRMVREGRITRAASLRAPLPLPLKWGGGPTLTDYLMWSRGTIPWPGPGAEPGTDADER